MDPVIRYLRSHPWARRGLSVLSIVLLVSAVGMLGYPVYTNFTSDRIQGRLDREFASPQLKQAYEARTLQDGDALTRIKIPAINVDTVVVEGTSASALRAGAGHYPATPLPCEPGNVAIAGHRTTYKITVEPFIVAPTDLSVVANDPAQKTVTLTTCHPRGSAKQRLVVKATMVESKPAA